MSRTRTIRAHLAKSRIHSTPYGGVRVASVTRAVDVALFDKVLSATSNSDAHQAIAGALTQLDATVNDPKLETSPAALLSKLQSALQTYSAAPQSVTAGQSAVLAAKDLAQSLNSATQTVQQVREQADSDMSALCQQPELAPRAVRNCQQRNRQRDCQWGRCHRLFGSA